MNPSRHDLVEFVDPNTKNKKKRQNLTSTVDFELLAKPSVSIASKYLEATKATDQMVQTKHHTSCPIGAEKMQKLAKSLQKSDYQKVAQLKAPISNTYL